MLDDFIYILLKNEQDRDKINVYFAKCPQYSNLN